MSEFEEGRIHKRDTPIFTNTRKMASATSLHTPATLSTSDINSGTTGSGSSGCATVERRCENADCNVVKLVSMVPRRKITQFVTEPTVTEKPMLINGFTTIFQVDGTSAKLSEIKNPNGGNIPQNSIYRIVPNTHAHIVNYVVVDTDGDSMRKINESDPATMRKLLESQKVSADQMLKKLMVGHGTQSTTASMTAATSNTISGTTNALQMLPTQRPTVAANAASIPKASTMYTSTITAAQQQPTSSIQLPMRMHPNLKITAVASAETVAGLRASPTPTALSSTGALASVVAAPPVVPLITPVPLANLQSVAAVPVAASTPNVVDTVEKPVFDKMQAELQELRRTVAMLAEAQAKNQPVAQQQHRAAKRQRPN